MKKIFLLLAIASLSIGAMAQGSSKVQNLISAPASGSNVIDTVINTGVVTMTSPIVAGASNTTTVTATFTKLTGTVAGTATLLGSVNGTDWASASSTSYTVTDVASATTSWVLSFKPFLYYRISVAGSGTSTYVVKGQVLSVIP